jgi:hypothetical protein
VLEGHIDNGVDLFDVAILSSDIMSWILFSGLRALPDVGNADSSRVKPDEKQTELACSYGACIQLASHYTHPLPYVVCSFGNDDCHEYETKLKPLMRESLN